ncbi:hypothetical protein [Mycolicibacterium moriokaense]|uniref:Uncharacterized protein n=1 Tax=Mycolicibacterium moriokaense TaxID=39691 RepID=A0A318HDV5_9MYCO|nr:hypothetical protein [Mycolicibacterium moriokaense]PXX02499.1 hypothetical protein C8E89_12445 [Mycolicibacterium moriokaense]
MPEKITGIGSANSGFGDEPSGAPEKTSIFAFYRESFVGNPLRDKPQQALPSADQQYLVTTGPSAAGVHRQGWRSSFPASAVAAGSRSKTGRE